MKWLKTIAVYGVLGLWLAATNHCRLEQVPGLSFLAWCEEGGNSQDNDCQNDSCNLVENGLYKTENSQIKIVAPVLVFVDFVSTQAESCAPPQTVCGLQIDCAPPELPRVWQFSFRAAAPPRAPSIAS